MKNATARAEGITHPTAPRRLHLKVKDFSCLAEADIRINRFTVLIGPQSSGKSLLSKLIFFFNQAFISLRNSATLKGDEDSFKLYLRDTFSEWFPISAWGSKKFTIEFSHADLQIKIIRSTYNDAINDKLRISLSPLVKKILSARDKFLAEDDQAAKKSVEGEFDNQSFSTPDKLRAMMREAMKESYLASQLFVPAGRSFFTSMGTTVAAFRQARLLDPVTLAFGEVMTRYRDRGGFAVSMGAGPRHFQAVEKLLGGVVRFGQSGDFLVTPDGRTVPFSSLSSGQQELLPLLLTLSPFLSPLPSSVGRRFVCVEEPEAHLFPSAQSSVVGLLASVTSGLRNDLLITTHSPYVLAKINNLIVAGKIIRNATSERRAALSKIVEPRHWLQNMSVSAYAIQGDSTVDIIDADGLIAADYLDEVSGHISEEFNNLLELGEM